MRTRCLFILGGLVLCVGLHAQRSTKSKKHSFQASYDLLLRKQYAQAYEGFNKCCLQKKAHPLRQEALFYQGVALYYQQRYLEATQLFVELEQAVQTDTLQALTRYMRARTKLAQGDSLRAYRLLAPLRTSLVSERATQACEALSKQWTQQQVPQLLSMQIELPTDTLLDHTLARLIQGMPALDRDKLHVRLSPTEKEVFNDLFRLQAPRPGLYQVAALLPLPKQKASAHFIVQLYAGMLLAMEGGLDQQLQLRVYDTQKNDTKTRSILDTWVEQLPDLVIGPFHRGPVEALKHFCRRYHVPLLNPLSTNQEIISENSWAKLFHASNKTHIRALAEYTRTRFTRPKTVAIFCEQTPKVYTLCKDYMIKMRQAGYKIMMEYYAKDLAFIRDMLTEVVTETVDLAIDETDSLTEESIAKITANYAAQGYLLHQGGSKYSEGKDRWQIERWKVSPGSIGHIFLGTTSALLPAYVVGAIEVRPDTIPVVMPVNLLSNANLDYNQMERLGVYFYANNYIDVYVSAYHTFEQAFLKRWGYVPSEVAAMGYELMHYVAWQRGQSAGGQSKTYTGPLGLRVTLTQDNQQTELLQFKQGRLEQVDDFKR